MAAISMARLTASAHAMSLRVLDAQLAERYFGMVVEWDGAGVPFYRLIGMRPAGQTADVPLYSVDPTASQHLLARARAREAKRLSELSQGGDDVGVVGAVIKCLRDGYICEIGDVCGTGATMAEAIARCAMILVAREEATRPC
jgi:hypothetical protein